MADGPRVVPGDLELCGELLNSEVLTLRQARELMERKLIQDALRRQAGNLTQVALDLGISRPTLYDLMQKLNLNR